MVNKDLEDKIELAEKCGLFFTGCFEKGKPQFIGGDKAWTKFNDKEDVILEAKKGELVIKKF